MSNELIERARDELATYQRCSMKTCEDLIAALSAQPSGVVDRDGIARIIDPHSFMDIPFTDEQVLLDMVEQSKQDALRKADRILSALSRPASVEGGESVAPGWIVGNGTGLRWRTWKDGLPNWTSNRDEATRYARREDAEAAHREDEDAWIVVPYSRPRRAGTIAHIDHGHTALTAAVARHLASVPASGAPEPVPAGDMERAEAEPAIAPWSSSPDGFEPRDFAYLAELLLSNDGEATLKARLSNNVNVIIAALRRAASPHHPAKPAVQDDFEKHNLARFGSPAVAPLGLYRVYWKSGGSSLAAIGMMENGDRWIAPTNWTRPLTVPSAGEWGDIERLEPILADAAAAAKPAVQEGIECHGLDTPERVCFYEQDFYVLSNFSAFSLRLWGGIRFDTSEAAYHWAKFDLELPASREVQNSIYHARSAHDAFKIAERNKHLRRPDWDDVKVDIMRNILRAKAAQHEYVRRKLLATGERELVENSWRDDFWGWGPNRDGKNMLGNLWMEVRAEIRAASPAPQEPASEVKP